MAYQSQTRSARLSLVGDVMLSRALTPFQEPAYLEMRRLLRESDLTFANLETVVRHPEEGHPNFTMGTPMTTAPELLDDLKWLGVQLLSVANNHATDYGVSGVESMLDHLREARIRNAGAGRNLAAARAPCYVDTPAGRVGLVAATSFFRPWNSAADQRPDAQGRPGVNPLGFKTTHVVKAEDLALLRHLGHQLGLSQERARHARQFFSPSELGANSERELTLFGHHFRQGDDYAVETKVNPLDADANLKALAEARRQCDWLIFSFHNHEFGDGGRLTAASDVDLTEPGRFAAEFARAAIDAGADVVAGHGHHLTLGVEIHRDRPIFHGLGNFIFQNDTVEQFPAEAYRRFGLGHTATPADFLDARTQNDSRGFPAEAEFWGGALARVNFDDGALRQIEIHPLDLGFGTRRSERGRPMLAKDDRATAIMDRIARLSTQHGTHLHRAGGSLVLNPG